MLLKSIELSGFKSFAKKGVLEFTTPISAIVGPNGSGKSNVAEAFRFVLGEQSIKSMRGKKGEDLIFNGAGSEPRANRASVKLSFDNIDKTFSIDFPEVLLERVVHRDGVNEYFINGSKVRLKDVLELLAGARIGTSGHHIISQGEADKILSATPRERKGFVEDALGLRLYQYKRLESERKLSKTFENITQVESLRKEIAPHLRFLKKQVEKVEKAVSMKEELVALSHQYFRRESLYISLTRVSIENERSPLETALNNLREELARAKDILAENAKSEKKDYAVLELENEISGARVHLEGLNRELGKTEGLIAAEERIIRKEKELIASSENKMIRLKDVEELASALEEDMKKGEVAEDASIFAAIISNLREKISLFIKERKDSSDSRIMIEAEKALEELKSEKLKLEEKVKEAQEKETKLGQRYEELKSAIEKEKDTSRDAEKAVFRIMSEENELISKINLLKAREERLSLEDEEFKRELEEVSHLVGVEILRYKDIEIENEQNILQEERRVQEERKRAVEKLKIRLEDAGITGTEEVLKEYQETFERDEFLARELLDLEKSAQSLNELIKNLEERLAHEFSTGLAKINKEFSELFISMFGGGDARLTLTRSKKQKIDALIENSDELVDTDDSDEVIEEGLEISVNLPRKKVGSLMMLSGGERALTSIALVFAISQVNPPPFIILDETDAALDESNSKKYGDLVEKLAERSQLILITHNRETMSRAGVIYGVTISSTGASKLLSIAFDQAVEVAK
jgi:chromosome segregation protein